ncbi:hypothetical protein L3X38_013708 [Prunus dulcis]|uniref:Importin N-terminal domain-containing protein n=1 Tax=Prunus dulcis TaxID=3755 RepID=A0AAD4ZHM1_PRUDU|nr:hypothetical protein L3X38_013708 [Prunus dulcis]
MSLISSRVRVSVYSGGFIAEPSLFEASQCPNYNLAFFNIVAQPVYNEKIRQAASFNFKNQLKSQWGPDSSSKDEPTISEVENEKIKASIVSLMLSATHKIWSQLTEIVVLICKHDWPDGWPNLLPDLISRLQKANADNDILGIANSIFKSFGYECNHLKYFWSILPHPFRTFSLKPRV